MKPVVASTAYLLISHGSRDPRPQEAMNRLADLVRQHLEKSLQPPNAALQADCEALKSSVVSSGKRAFLDADSAEFKPERYSKGACATTLLVRPRLQTAPTTPAEVIVGTACLELAPVPLSQQIHEFALRLEAAGVDELKLLPVFLMPGVHVMKDIPEEIAAAKELLEGSAIKLTPCPHLGSHTKISEVLKSRLASVPAEGSILVAHGSRRPKGNQAIKGLARQLNTSVAYWSTPPDIETQVIDLMQQGCQKLTILPYFLFAGGITDAITHRTEELAERFPKVNFRLLPTLGATDEMASLAVELVN